MSIKVGDKVRQKGFPTEAPVTVLAVKEVCPGQWQRPYVVAVLEGAAGTWVRDVEFLVKAKP